jgi:hypothetical protein
MGVRYVGGTARIVASTPVSVAKPATVAVAPAASPVARPAAVREATGFAAHEAAPVQAPVLAASESHITQAPVTVPTEPALRSPFSDGIVITFSDIREPAPDYAQRAVFGSDRDFEPASTPARAPKADPLAGLDPAAERRARLLAPALPAYASGSSRAVASDWMKTRASSNERMYESMDQGPSDRMLVGFRF